MKATTLALVIGASVFAAVSVDRFDWQRPAPRAHAKAVHGWLDRCAGSGGDPLVCECVLEHVLGETGGEASLELRDPGGARAARLEGYEQSCRRGALALGLIGP